MRSHPTPTIRLQTVILLILALGIVQCGADRGPEAPKPKTRDQSVPLDVRWTADILWFSDLIIAPNQDDFNDTNKDFALEFALLGRKGKNPNHNDSGYDADTEDDADDPSQSSPSQQPGNANDTTQAHESTSSQPAPPSSSSSSNNSSTSPASQPTLNGVPAALLYQQGDMSSCGAACTMMALGLKNDDISRAIEKDIYSQIVMSDDDAKALEQAFLRTDGPSVILKAGLRVMGLFGKSMSFFKYSLPTDIYNYVKASSDAQIEILSDPTVRERLSERLDEQGFTATLQNIAQLKIDQLDQGDVVPFPTQQELADRLRNGERIIIPTAILNNGAWSSRKEVKIDKFVQSSHYFMLAHDPKLNGPVIIDPATGRASAMKLDNLYARFDNDTPFKVKFDGTEVDVLPLGLGISIRPNAVPNGN